MRIERSTFLAGFAALALLAATGFASAQETGKEQKAKHPHAAMQQMSKRHTAGKMSQTQQQAQKPKRQAQAKYQGKAYQGKMTARLKTGTMAQRRHVTGPAMAQRRDMAALQGYAGPPRHRYARLHAKGAPRTLQLTEEQRARIRGTVMSAQWAHNVNFGISAGAVVPRGSVNVTPLPDTLVSIHPAWRGMEYFVYAHDLVIVNPRTMRIVAVVPA